MRMTSRHVRRQDEDEDEDEDEDDEDEEGMLLLRIVCKATSMI